MMISSAALSSAFACVLRTIQVEVQTMTHACRTQPVNKIAVDVCGLARDGATLLPILAKIIAPQILISGLVDVLPSHFNSSRHCEVTLRTTTEDPQGDCTGRLHKSTRLRGLFLVFGPILTK